MTTVDEALDKADSRQGIVLGACLDARHTASILAEFYRTLKDGDVEENAATQMSIIYARKVLKQT